MRLLTIEQAEKLTTKRLLAYYRSRRPQKSQEYDWYEEDEILVGHLQLIKNILDSREHIEREK